MVVYPNAIPKDLCDEVYRWATGLVLTCGHSEPAVMWSNYSWRPEIVKDSAPVFCLVLNEQLTNAVYAYLYTLGMGNSKPTFINDGRHGRIMAYVWTKGSYIPVHVDNGKDETIDSMRKTVTIYTNPEWDITCGGVFQYLNSSTNTWSSILPTQGTLVYNDKNEYHLTTPVMTPRMFRVTIQSFISEAEQPRVPIRY